MVGAAPVQYPSEAARDSAFQIDQLWQTSLREADPSHEMLVGLREALLKDLDEDYSDVVDQTTDPRLVEARDRLRSRLRDPSAVRGVPSLAATAAAPDCGGLSIESLVQACYSGPHWRRAARHRLAELAAEPGRPLAGIIMGHTHYADQFTWQDDAGQPQWYVNSGSWRHDSADLVVVEGSTVQGFKRNWKGPLPTL